MAKPIVIEKFRGINKSHTRDINELSGGKNFRIVNGRLLTRPGSVSVTPPSPSASIKSLHAAPKVSVDTRLLLEEGTNLWHKTTGAWTTIKTGLNGTRLNSDRWFDYLILVNGNDKLAYDVANMTIANLGGTPPAMQHVLTWKFRIFGWAPDFSAPHRLYFCGYDANQDISKDVWPSTYFLNIGGSSGLPIQNCIPFPTHLVCFTKKYFKRVYGDTEANFEILDGADVGLYAPRLAVLVGDILFFVGDDRKIYAYSGSSPVYMSSGIDELLDNEDYATGFMLNLDNKLWLIFPGASTSNIYMFDPTEGGWFADVYPAVITAGYSHGAYNSPESVYFGTGAGTMFKLDNSIITDFNASSITTEAELGPIDVGGADFWLNTAYVQADPKSSFGLSIYATCDRRTQQGPFSTSFTAGAQDYKEIPLKQVRGMNIMLKLSSSDRIKELQKITVVPSTSWGVR